MPGRTILITGCDRRYLALLESFIASVREAGGLDRVDLGIFDLDFTEPERARLAQSATGIVTARSPLSSLMPANDRGRRTLPSLVRPYLPELFPGYDIYVYSDVDVWVQDWRGFELFIEGASRGRLAIAPQVDRAYVHGSKSHSYRFTVMASVFGEEAAKVLVRMPHMNAGIFALPAAAPHWQRWAEIWRGTLQDNKFWFGSGQAVLTHMIYNENMPAELLPGICNWQSHLAMPMWDEQQRCFVEPCLPHQKILLMHMTDDTKWLAQRYRTVQGNIVANAALGFEYYKKLRDGEIVPQPPGAQDDPATGNAGAEQAGTAGTP